jgi:hypothetical protein
MIELNLVIKNYTIHFSWILSIYLFLPCSDSVKKILFITMFAKCMAQYGTLKLFGYHTNDFYIPIIKKEHSIHVSKNIAVIVSGLILNLIVSYFAYHTKNFMIMYINYISLLIDLAPCHPSYSGYQILNLLCPIVIKNKFIYSIVVILYLIFAGSMM